MAKPRTSEKIPGADVPDVLFPAIDAVAREALGDDDARGEGLAEEVRALSALYTRRREEIGDDDRSRLVAARLRFFLPRDLPKVALPLHELWRAGALPRARPWRVLDLGAGLGTTTLGAARFARAVGATDALEVVAVDPWARGLDLFERLASKLDPNDFATVRVKRQTGRMEAREPAGPFDLILLGLSLNEWARGQRPEDAASLLVDLARGLRPTGSMIVLEPALHAEARFLQATRDALAAIDGAPAIFAPCVSPEPCPMLPKERDWCHAELGGELENEIAEIARRAGLRRSRRTFAYLTLHRGEARARQLATPHGYRVVSEVLASKGKLEAFLCGDGALVRLRLMKRERAPHNEDFADLERGDLVEMDHALPGETGAYRLTRGDALRRSR